MFALNNVHAIFQECKSSIEYINVFDTAKGEQVRNPGVNFERDLWHCVLLRALYAQSYFTRLNGTLLVKQKKNSIIFIAEIIIHNGF